MGPSTLDEEINLARAAPLYAMNSWSVIRRRYQEPLSYGRRFMAADLPILASTNFYQKFLFRNANGVCSKSFQARQIICYYFNLKLASNLCVKNLVVRMISTLCKGWSPKSTVVVGRARAANGQTLCRFGQRWYQMVPQPPPRMSREKNYNFMLQQMVQHNGPYKHTI